MEAGGVLLSVLIPIWPDSNIELKSQQCQNVREAELKPDRSMTGL